MLSYWAKEEFAERVRRLCQLAEIDGFDITNSGEREQARKDIEALEESRKEQAKTERDEYLDILDCIDSYENNKNLYKDGAPSPVSPRSGERRIAQASARGQLQGQPAAPDSPDQVGYFSHSTQGGCAQLTDERLPAHR